MTKSKHTIANEYAWLFPKKQVIWVVAVLAFLKSVLIINNPNAKTKTGIGSVNVPSNVSALKTVPLELKLYFIGILSPIYQTESNGLNQTGQAS